MPPVIATPHYYLITVQRDSVSLVAACKQEVPPLFVIEFLHRVVDTFQDYFGDCSESVIKDNYVVVYELLDEMLDNGFPLATESNILKELIKPPNILRTIANTVTGKSKCVCFPFSLCNLSPSSTSSSSCSVSTILPSGQLSAIPWRRSGVRYTNNEAYFDVIEEVDAIIDKSGSTVFAEIQGHVSCQAMFTYASINLAFFFLVDRLLHQAVWHAGSDVVLHESTPLRRRLIPSVCALQALGSGASALLYTTRWQLSPYVVPHQLAVCGGYTHLH